MSRLYPLLMVPDFDPRPWGTMDLSPIYPNQRCNERIGEAWLTGDACKVANGAFMGQPLSTLSSTYGAELVGDAAADAHRFPLLLKFLFPHEKLSVQVHPDDLTAQGSGLPNGKTECWYVAYAKPGAQIGLGLKAGVTRQAFEQAIQANRAEELLNWIDVHAGEMIYVAGGTVHTLGPGVDHRGDPTAVGHDLSFVRLRAAARTSLERRDRRDKRTGSLGESCEDCADRDERFRAAFFADCRPLLCR